MKTISINKGLSILIDDEDYQKVTKYKWYFDGFYVKTMIEGKNTRLHRLIMNAPLGTIVDHISRDRLDNRKTNLRFCDKYQSNQNRAKPQSKSGYKGVFSHREKWQVKIKAHGKRVHIGIFETKEQAALAYNKAALKYHGEYAVLNILGGING